MKSFQLLVLIFLAQNLLGQNAIHGLLVDQNQESVPSATVSVVRLPDSTLVSGVTTNPDGEFR
ncbi:carboxypeptidase-like regulatory domain-containing protein [Salegentibacter sp. F14]